MRHKQARLIVGVKALRLPRSITPYEYFRTLLRVLESGSDLPRGWEVQLRWQNPETVSGRTRFMQYDDFDSAISQSNAGFRSVVRRMLVSYLYGARSIAKVPLKLPKKRRVSKKKKVRSKKR